MQKVLIAFLSRIALDLLKGLAQAVWDGFWATVFEAIKTAEQTWHEKGKGKLKREWVIDYVFKWLDARTKLNPIQRWAVKVFIGRIADTIIEELNKELGKSWTVKVSELRQYLADRIPFIA